MITIHQLRSAGYKIRCLHFRNVNRNAKKNDEMSLVASCSKEYQFLPNGGKSIVQIRTPSGVEYEGVAFCSINDNFNRKFGLVKALGRAFGKIDK